MRKLWIVLMLSILLMPSVGGARQVVYWITSPLCFMRLWTLACPDNPLDPACHYCNQHLRLSGFSPGDSYQIRLRDAVPPYKIRIESPQMAAEPTVIFHDLITLFPPGITNYSILEIIIKTKTRGLPDVYLIVTDVEGNFSFDIPAIIRRK